MVIVSQPELTYQTPGVYIPEIEAFGTGIVGVQTAMPVFIGYTEFAGDPTTGAALYGVLTVISSMSEYAAYFGGAAPQDFAVSLAAPGATPSFTAYYTPSGGAAQLQGFMLAPKAGQPRFALYWQMQLFFANGGGTCYIVSAGSYWAGHSPVSLPDPDGWLPGMIAASDLTSALTAASFAEGPTMIVVPEACQLGQADYGAIACAMMVQASSLQDRMAILDLPGCLTADSFAALTACQSDLWNAIAPQIASASYAAAYAPALVTSVASASTLRFTNLLSGDNSLINSILTTQAAQLFNGEQLATIQAAIATAFPLTGLDTNTPALSGDGSAYPARTSGQTLAQWQGGVNAMLQSSLPVFTQIEQLAATMMNVLAPSGAMAGAWTRSDNMNGVWNAPANIALAMVSAPLYNMSDVEQGGFNVPVNGEAIDVIRAQINRGTVVWGARTLDGNSLDYRYIQVRRTLIYIQQSIKLALQPYAFSPNDATTWSTVSASISSFLTGVWQQGGLMGSTASQAFTVSVGLGSTMTAQDILNGDMNVAVTLQMIHPAEFIELTFTQKMGS
jgi:phage tail sheath protein FI